MKHIIHVNQHNIKSNATKKTNLPVITVKNYKKNNYCNNVAILDDNGNQIAIVKYSPDKPLSCGAKVWIETKNPIQIL